MPDALLSPGTFTLSIVSLNAFLELRLISVRLVTIESLVK